MRKVGWDSSSAAVGCVHTVEQEDEHRRGRRSSGRGETQSDNTFVSFLKLKPVVQPHHVRQHMTSKGPHPPPPPPPSRVWEDKTFFSSSPSFSLVPLLIPSCFSLTGSIRRAERAAVVQKREEPEKKKTLSALVSHRLVCSFPQMPGGKEDCLSSIFTRVKCRL